MFSPFAPDMRSLENALLGMSDNLAAVQRRSVKGQPHQVPNNTRRADVMAHVPSPKRVITNGPKTIVLWEDGTKTIVTCGETEINDTYAGFCAAVVKKLFGSTSRAKKVLNAFLVEQDG